MENIIKVSSEEPDVDLMGINLRSHIKHNWLQNMFATASSCLPSENIYYESTCQKRSESLKNASTCYEKIWNLNCLNIDLRQYEGETDIFPNHFPITIASKFRISTKNLHTEMDQNNKTETFRDSMTKKQGLVHCNLSVNHCWWLECLLFLFYFLTTIAAEPLIKQQLPKGCQGPELKDCPSFDVEEDKLQWHNFNFYCCHNYSGTAFHCYLNETEYISACVASQWIPAGKTAYLTATDAGDPFLQVIGCDPGYYNPVGKWSHTVNTHGCTRPKIKCSAEHGKQLLCTGGEAADDRCTCLAEYIPSPYVNGCREGFDFNNPNNCYCKESSCSDGTARNITLMKPGFTMRCSDLHENPFYFDSICYSLSDSAKGNMILTVTDKNPSNHMKNTTRTNFTTLKETALLNNSKPIQSKPNDGHSSNINRFWLSFAVFGLGMLGVLLYIYIITI